MNRINPSLAHKSRLKEGIEAMSDDDVRFNVQMPESLREDAKANAERGDLSEEVRDLFRRKAYGTGGVEQVSELEETKAELREVRNRIDSKRMDRSQLDAKIQSLEARANRLEERVAELQEKNDKETQYLEVLEEMLKNGTRLWPVMIKNKIDVDIDTAKSLYQELQGRNAELPDAAFAEPKIHQPADWREVDN